jgi:hypothetical protein
VVRDLSSRLEYPIKTIDELDEQIGRVTLGIRKSARIKDVLPYLQENCGEKRYFPIVDAADLQIKGGRLLETKGFREYFLGFSPDEIK